MFVKDNAVDIFPKDNKRLQEAIVIKSMVLARKQKNGLTKQFPRKQNISMYDYSVTKNVFEINAEKLDYSIYEKRK